MTPRLFQRPQSVSEVLDAAFRLFKRSLLPNLPVCLLAVLLGQVPSAYVFWKNSAAPFRDPVWWLLYLISTSILLVLWATLLLRQHAMVCGTALTMRSAARAALQLLPRMWLLTVVSILLIALGLLLLFIPGVYLGIGLWFAGAVLILRRAPLLTSIDESLKLVRGNWWRSSTIMGVAFLVIFIFYGVGTAVGLVLAPLVGGSFEIGRLLMLVIFDVMGGLFMPFLTALTVAQFEDLSLRREGADLAQRIDGLAQG
jgi:hypothetical protein